MKKLLLLLSLGLTILTIQAQRTVGALKNDSNSFNGYTLIAPLTSTEAYLIDNCGEVVNQWQSSSFRPGASVYLLEDGSLMRTGKLLTGSMVAGGSGGRLERYDWNDNLIWEYDFDDTLYRSHHDINVLPNGNILVLAWDRRSKQEAVLAGLDTNQYNGEVWSEKIVEITPVGSNRASVVWEWFLWDHIVQDFNPTASNFGSISQNEQLVDLNFPNNSSFVDDYFHANGIDYNPDLDQIMISVRNYDEIWVIDHSTTTQEAASNMGGNSGKGGDILYRWGNPETYRGGTLADKKLFGQHNPNWVPKGYRDEGKILVFNNGYNDTNQISKAQLISPPVDSLGNYTKLNNLPYEPVAPSWSYNLPVFVDFVSGLHRLPNGNTLICSGPDGHLYELDSLDNVVWEYVSPAEPNGGITVQGATPSGNTLFRAYKYASNYPAFTNRTLTPNGTIETNITPTNCVIFNGTTSIADNNSKSLDVKIIENPIVDELRIENSGQAQLTIRVFDLLGKQIFETNSSNNLIEIESSSWDANFYIVLINQGNKTFRQKVVKL